MSSSEPRRRARPRAESGVALRLLGACLALLACVASACTAPTTLARQCVFNGDCTAPLVCAGGFCRAQCASDRDCNAPETCRRSDEPDKSVCLPPGAPALCAQDADCPQPRGVCDDGVCYASCNANADCGSVVMDGDPAVCEQVSHHCLRPVSVAQEVADAHFDPLPEAGPLDGGIDATAMDAPTDAPREVAIDVAGCDATCGTGACVDLATDVNNCGVCGLACPAVPGGTIACVAGACIPSCNPGFTMCGNGCVDLNTSAQHCGSCDTSCPVACSARACVTATKIWASSGGTHALSTTFIVRLSDGALRAWGGGNWVTSASAPPFPIATSTRPVPLVLPGVAAADDVYVGPGVLCVRAAMDGSVRCAGVNSNGNLGIGSTTDTTTLTPLAGGFTNLLGVAVSDTHGCFWRPESTPGAHDQVVCWGANESGELGDGTTSATPRPTPTAAGHARVTQDVTEMAVGTSHTCAIYLDGSLNCWGDDTFDQLANVAPDGGTGSPVPLQANSNFVGSSVLVSADRNACVAHGQTSGYTQCWGLDDYGQSDWGTGLGGSTTGGAQLANYGSAAATTATHTCVIYLYGIPSGLKCFGSNLDGELGIFSTGPARGVPATMVPVAAGSTDTFEAAAVAVGPHVTCAIATNDPFTPDGGVVLTPGAVYCWGSGDHGALGTGSLANTNGVGAPVAF